MPHFTLGLDPQMGGPLLTAVVGVSEPRAAALAAVGQPIPQALPIRGLVDTGASGTCIDPAVLIKLGLTPSGNTLCHTPTTGAAPELKDLYDVSLRIYSDLQQPSLYHATLPVMASDLFAAQGFHALIGRDVLSSCLLTYNGTLRYFTLAF